MRTTMDLNDVRLILFALAALAQAADLRTDIEFARIGDVRLTLDAYVPEGPGPFPAVIVVHGGGFTAGDKQTYVKPLFDPLTRGGFAWFTINYRLARKYPFPAAVEDVERAVRYVRSHAREYKIDPRRLALMGESAGGHLVSFVGAQNKPDARIAAVVSFYGPHDFEARAVQQGKLSDSVQAFLGVRELNEESRRTLREASPITHVRKGMPPFLLIHGTVDPLVPYDQSVKMCERMKQVGSRCEVFTVEGAGHGVENWEKNPAHQAYKQKMVEWLKENLRAVARRNLPEIALAAPAPLAGFSGPLQRSQADLGVGCGRGRPPHIFIACGPASLLSCGGFPQSRARGPLVTTVYVY